MNGSAYPVPVDVLVPKALELAAETGSLPSQARLKRELKIGTDKAREVLAQLAAGELEYKVASTVAPAPELAPEPVLDAPLPPPPPAVSAPVAVAASEVESTRSSAGRWHAWGGFLFAAVASLAANVAHAHDGWGPRLTAAFAPLALVLAVEVAARVDWRAGREWWLARWVGTGGVAVITFVVSYRAQAALFKGYGLDWLSAAILPLAVDGLMLVCIAALLSIGNRRK